MHLRQYVGCLNVNKFSTCTQHLCVENDVDSNSLLVGVKNVERFD